MKDRIEKRIGELKKSLEDLQNNANAHIGAIQELERLLKEIDNGVPVSAAAGLNGKDMSDNPV